MAALALAFAASAQAATYTNTGSPLSTGALTSGVAVDQSTHNVYVASCGEAGENCNTPGAFKEFDSSGSELSCTLEGSPEHPAAVAVNRETGETYVLNLTGFFSATMLTYEEGCGTQQSAEFAVEAGLIQAIVPQSVSDSSGNLYVPFTGGGKVEECTPAGSCTPVISGLTNPAAAALDSAGNLYVQSGAASCASPAAGKLVKYAPDGEGGFTEVGAFAGLDGSEAAKGEVTEVAVDRTTGEVFVGRGCGESYRVEQYGPGGTELAEFGSGEFGEETTAFNPLSIDEESGAVYAADAGNAAVQVFEDTSAQKTLSTSTSGGLGSVQCNGTGSACLSEYDEGAEVIVEAAGGELAEWNGGTGSAAACNGSTEANCSFLLEENSSINAEFEETATEYPLTVHINKAEGTVVSNPAGIECSGAPGTTCESEYEEGTEVTLTASPAEGTRFNFWVGCPEAGENGLS